MAARNPIRQAVQQFDGSYERLARSLSEEIGRLIDVDGLSPYDAVRKAFREFGVEDKLTKSILDGIVEIAVKQEPSIDKLAYRKWYLNKSFDKTGLTLSQTIVAQNWQSLVADIVSTSMRSAESVVQMARAVRLEGIVAGDIKPSIEGIISEAKRMYGGVGSDDFTAFRKALLQDARYIDRLAANGAPTGYLKKAYANVLKQVDRGADGALDAALDRAINAKMRYNAERIARTEMARSYGKGSLARMEKDPDAIGWRLVLSDRHPKDDICDTYAETDFYGMGPGVFPLGEGPEFPLHPNCLCLMEAVYSIDITGGVMDAPDPDTLTKEDVSAADVTIGNEPIPSRITA
jgi:hypothetical protein